MRRKEQPADPASSTHIWGTFTITLVVALPLLALPRWAARQPTSSGPSGAPAQSWHPLGGRPHAHCGAHAVPPPPALAPDVATAAAPLIDLLRAVGTAVVMGGNKSATELLLAFSQEERERIAYEAHTVALYTPGETAALRAAEEAGVLRAAPAAKLEELNGLNIGAGGRPVHEALLQVDAHRGLHGDAKSLPTGQTTPPNVLLAWADKLPFAPSSIDYIISLHNLEHLADPVGAVLHYLDILKPGGGVGVVIPHWQYAWRADKDNNAWGHRWNTAPEVVCELHARHWAHLAGLESLNTYPHRLSFDFVLRKKGTWAPFPQTVPPDKTGAALFAEGSFLGPVSRRRLRGVRAVPRDCA